MSPLQAVVLGAIQGLTEFLPVSSSGHLVWVPWILGWEAPGLAFDAVLHLGTLGAVLAYFRSDLGRIVVAGVRFLRDPSHRADPDGRTAWLIVVATLPAAIIGLAAADLLEELFENPGAVGWALIATGLLLLWGERVRRGGREASQLRVWEALAVGAGQALALFPGISRSGATIAAGLWRGLDRRDAARFSFLLAVPAVLGAGILQGLALLSEGDPEAGWALALGFASALASGYAAIRVLLRYLQRRSLLPFAGYCLVLGAVLAALYARG
ncbi:MAG: undecaprenyl-diphosphate phosphatase [Anaerolineae bacterium]